MQEWSPYGAIEPAHLNAFFRSKQGEFRLIALPENRTRLEGTTWYEQDIAPQHYWRLWSDFLVHTIHRRVLEHIKNEAEADGSGHRELKTGAAEIGQMLSPSQSG